MSDTPCASQDPIVLYVLCPHCGEPFTRPFPAPFDHSLSGLIDWLVLLEETARQTRRAAEEVVL